MGKRFIFLCALAIFLFPKVLSAAGEAEAPSVETGEKFGFGVEADFVSQYIWRGIAFSKGPVLQPSMYFSCYGLTFTTWGNFVLNDEVGQGQLNEVDFLLDYAYSRKNFFTEAVLLFYLYPNQDAPTTGEASVILGFQKGPFKIFTTQYVDMIAAPGAYFGLVSGSFEKEFHPDFSFKTVLGLGWANAKFNEFYLGVPQTQLNLLIWDLELRWKLHDPLYLRPHMQVTTLLPSALRESVEHPTIVSGGLGVGVEF